MKTSITAKGGWSKRTLPIIFSLSLVIAGCFGGGGSGGGGGGGGAVAPPSLPSPPKSPIVDSPTLTNPTVAELEGFYTAYLQRSLAGVEFGIISLDRAYANLYEYTGASAATRPGDGVTIGFIDSGLDTEHPAFEGKSATVEYFGTAFAGSDLAGGSHGTSVASIAAGVRQDWFVGQEPATSEGVAPGANIRMFAFHGNSFENLADAIEAATVAALDPARGVDILNLSLGLPNEEDGFYQYGIVSDSRYTMDGPSASDFTDAIQAGRAEKTLFVWAAGNEHNSACPSIDGIESCQSGAVNASSPGPLAGAMYLVPELRPHSVVVVATKLDGTIADFSNRCGVTADWCIAAPGEDIGVAYSRRNPDGTITRSVAVSITGIISDPRGAGTSFAAPIVAGGLALMKQRFRSQLSNVALLSRMFATATKSGAYADRSIYGQGLLNLGAATEPFGMVSTSSAGGAQFINDESGWQFAPLSETRVEMGEAFGDSLARSFAGKEIAGFDSLGAPFWYPLEAFALKTGKSTVLQQLLSFTDFSNRENEQAKQAGILSEEISVPLFAGKSGRGKGVFAENKQIPEIRVSMARGTMTTQNGFSKYGHLSFVDNPVSFGVQYENFAISAFSTDERGNKPSQGAVASYRLPNTPLGLRSGYIAEQKSALGTAAQGAFGGLSTSTVFAGIDWDYDFGNWKIIADAEIGVANSGTETGLIGDVSPLTTSSFSASLIRKISGNSAIRVSVSSPIRIESGRMDITIPSGRTPEGAILNNTISADLEPSGRQIDVGAQIVTQTPVGNLSFGGVVSREPGHNKNSDSSVSFLTGYSVNL
ncbi:S8 family peptidase [Candidatus Mycalebacterium sp.]